MQIESEVTTGGSMTPASREGKYLTFELDGEEYGLEILKVKEIIGIMNITSVPQTPDYVKGVINLRGKVIPVIDLRLKFIIEPIEYSDRTCIIIVDIASASGKKVMVGIVVDSVSEVLNIKDDEIEDSPNFGGRLGTEYIMGIAKVKGGVKILLDIDQVLNAEELNVLDKAA